MVWGVIVEALNVEEPGLELGLVEVELFKEIVLVQEVPGRTRMRQKRERERRGGRGREGGREIERKGGKGGGIERG